VPGAYAGFVVVVGTRLSFAGSNARANYFSRFPNLDYVALARACGGVGFKAEKPGELREDINKALNADGPAIVDTKVIFGRKFDDCHSARPAGKLRHGDFSQMAAFRASSWVTHPWVVTLRFQMSQNVLVSYPKLDNIGQYPQGG
jgi:hypothetical protein